MCIRDRYCHPEDQGFGASWFCKALVIAGLTLSWAQVLMLPLDVANSRGTGGGFEMDVMWLWTYGGVWIFVTLLIPFAMFFYESDEDKTMGKRFMWAFCMTFGAFIIIAIVIFISYNFFKFADVPYAHYTMNVKKMEYSDAPLKNLLEINKAAGSLTLGASFVVYLMACMSFVGWFLFVIFGGVGLSALPLDLIHEYRTRPIIRDAKTIVNKQLELRRRCTELIELGKALEVEKDDAKTTSGFWAKRKAEGAVGKKKNEFQKEVYLLEEEYEILKMEKDFASVNPLVWIGKLVLGIFLCLISILWYIHIALYVLWRSASGVPFTLFLNSFLLGLEEIGLGFIATAFFAGFTLYLLWCTTKGNIKFGLKIFLISLHPMKLNETWMNSFLFNVLMILLTSVSVTQFCASSFSQYTRLTSIDLIFGTQVKYMRFFSFFFKNNAFVWALMIWATVVCLYLAFRKGDRAKITEKAAAALKKSQARSST
eukprot:TRINITY_DN3424_c0_g2_i4.p1 TRINITY_DN3424_c0_g2~~TRINITY_DN3424_c0_g2_i4.p1  ORF type:complete len:483 (+),score=109.01 TRINITY_DN3424_c0_g2_i4:66-1514(+)